MTGMKRLVAGSAWAIAAVLWGGGAAHAEIRWETKLDRPSAAARESNQPLLIEFWAVWCEPRQEMDRDLYASARLEAPMAKVRPVRVDIDRDPGVARKYDISGTPTLVIA